MMLISSSTVSTHEGVAYHLHGGAAQDILEIDREEGQSKEALEDHPVRLASELSRVVH